MDVSGRAHRGVLSGADMAAWSATSEDPIGYDYGRYRVLKPAPWCQGVVALQQLALLKAFAFDDLDPTGPDFIHLQVEAAKLAFADRDTFYGDPNFVETPVDVLLSDAYNAKRRALVGERASRAAAGFGRRISEERSKPGARRVSDASRGWASPPSGAWASREATPSSSISSTALATWSAQRRRAVGCESSPTIPELGFCLGTRAQMFTLDERHPACLKPGKRPRTTLSPTLALRDGEPYLAWGTPGGDQQDQWIPQFFLRHVHAGFNLQEAIDAPAWHTEHFPSSFWPRAARPGVVVVEDRISRAENDQGAPKPRTRGRGRPGMVRGKLVAASRDKDRMKAAANPRGMQGYAAGR